MIFAKDPPFAADDEEGPEDEQASASVSRRVVEIGPEPEVEAPGLSGVSDELTGLRPPAPGRVVRRLIPVVLLCGLIGWSWQALRELDNRKTPRVITDAELADGAKSSREPVDVVAARRPEEASGEEHDGDDSLGELSGKGVPSFLQTQVEALVGETTALQRVEAAISRQQVTLVNLWATWCEPCKRELPGLRRLFKEGGARGWDEQVRFVALMVDDSRTARAAHRMFGEQMPPGEFLVDRGLGGGVKAGLAKANLLSGAGKLPITLLLDCKRRVRWHHVGELAPADFTAIAEQVDALRADLGTRACREPVKPAQAPVQVDRAAAVEPEPDQEGPGVVDFDPGLVERPSRASESCNGDGVCGRGENCANCKRDCGCPAGEDCLVTLPTPRCRVVSLEGDG